MKCSKSVRHFAFLLNLPDYKLSKNGASANDGVRNNSNNNNNNNNGLVESKNLKILWDFTIQCDRKIEARRPDIVFVDKKEREVAIIDVAIPGDDRVKRIKNKRS